MQDLKEMIEGLKAQKAKLVKQIESIDITINIFEQNLLLQQAQSAEHSSVRNAEPITDEKTNTNLAILPPITSLPSRQEGYDTSATLTDKVLYFIKKKNRFMHTREIAMLIKEAEPNIYKNESLVEKLSSVVSNLGKSNRLIKYSHNGINRNTFWGFPQWLDINKKIKSGYEYDPKMIAENAFPGRKV